MHPIRLSLRSCLPAFLDLDCQIVVLEPLQLNGSKLQFGKKFSSLRGRENGKCEVAASHDDGLYVAHFMMFHDDSCTSGHRHSQLIEIAVPVTHHRHTHHRSPPELAAGRICGYLARDLESGSNFLWSQSATFCRDLCMYSWSSGEQGLGKRQISSQIVVSCLLSLTFP